MILDIVNREKWILDGRYRSTLEIRVKSADLIIFLDYSTFAKLKGVITRYLEAPNKEKPDIPGCRERIDWKFIKWIRNWNKTRRKFIIDVLERNKNKEIIIFKNRRQLNNWYKNIENKQDNFADGDVDTNK